jgi:Mg2+ and Co2+ transporter CorA
MGKNDFDRNITIAEQSRLTAERSQTIARLTKNDSAVMRDIAAASKQDSSSMKALAVLTMVLLPFTFIAVRPFLFIPNQSILSLVNSRPP